jgi:hypothetical protein
MTLMRTPSRSGLRLGVLLSLLMATICLQSCASYRHPATSRSESANESPTGQDPRNFTDAIFSGPPDISEYSLDQKSALSDGRVTRREYKTGFERFVGCVASMGFDIIRSGEVYGVIQYSIPVEALDNGADRKCYRKEFFALDETWQLFHEDFGYSAQILNKCLRAHRLPVPESSEEKLRTLEKSGVKVATCKS